MGGGNVPAHAARLRDQSAALRMRAAEHEAAGNALIAEKLREVAAKFESEAEQIERNAPRP